MGFIATPSNNACTEISAVERLDTIDKEAGLAVVPQF